MKHYIILLGMLILVLGCGKSTEKISKDEKIVIVHELGFTGCLYLEKRGNSKIQKDTKLKNTIKNISYSSKSNTVSCHTYGKEKSTLNSYNDALKSAKSIACAELYIADAQEAYPNKDFSLLKNNSKSCVVSFNTK